ncbi:MAG TPA: hypothetical protein VFU15_03860, partial [Bacteroidia bacterium]|nr:hypothetical protein [Bacteroidia bacterium]
GSGDEKREAYSSTFGSVKFMLMQDGIRQSWGINAKRGLTEFADFNFRVLKIKGSAEELPLANYPF